MKQTEFSLITTRQFAIHHYLKLLTLISHSENKTIAFSCYSILTNLVKATVIKDK